MRVLLLLALLAVAVTGIGGCGPDGPATYQVSGTVTYRGKPVKDGDILLIPPEANVAPEGGRIIDGKFSMQSKAGACRVEIRALNIGPDTQYISGSPIAENMIPPKYNDNSELTAEVTPNGPNEFNFDLK